MHASEGGESKSIDRRERLIVLAIGFFLVPALTYPTITLLRTAGRLDSGDGRFSIWNVAWVAHSLVDNPRELFNANIFFPHPHTLTYSEMNLVAGVFAAPMYALTHNPLAAHNTSVLIALLFSFFAMWALVRRLTGSPRASVVAAVAYTFSPYTSSHTAEIQLLMLFGFPLVMLAFHNLQQRPSVGAGAWLGGALAVTALACGYYGVFSAGLVVISSLWFASRRVEYWVALGVGVVVAVLLVLPVLGPYLHYRSLDGVARIVRIDDLRLFSANWRSYLASSTDLGILWTVPLSRTGPLQEVLFPGISVVLFTGVALWIARRDNQARWLVLGYCLMAALAVWGSFGPSGGLYVLVAKILPGGMSFLRAPSRLGAVVVFTLSVVTGVAYARVGGDRKWFAAVVLAFLIFELRVAWPLQRVTTLPRAYYMLALLPRGGVVEFPFPYKSTDFHNHTRAMMRSMWNWQPLVNGYSDHIPDDFYQIALPINRFPDPESFAIMKTHDVRYVLVRVNDYAGTYRDPLLARFLPYDKNLRLLTDDGDVRLYEIVKWPGASPLDAENVRSR